MESPTEQQRTKIMKMSDSRLRSKLVEAGYRPDDIAQLERTQLIKEWT